MQIGGKEDSYYIPLINLSSSTCKIRVIKVQTIVINLKEDRPSLKE